MFNNEVIESCAYLALYSVRHRNVLVCSDTSLSLFIFFYFFYFFLYFFFSYYIQHCFICRPSDSTVPTDAGIEPRTVATGALAVRRSNH
jgi:hypothetical protein